MAIRVKKAGQTTDLTLNQMINRRPIFDPNHRLALNGANIEMLIFALERIKKQGYTHVGSFCEHDTKLDRCVQTLKGYRYESEEEYESRKKLEDIFGDENESKK
jgi:hypothetical protein